MRVIVWVRVVECGVCEYVCVCLCRFWCVRGCQLVCKFCSHELSPSVECVRAPTTSNYLLFGGSFFITAGAPELGHTLLTVLGHALLHHLFHCGLAFAIKISPPVECVLLQPLCLCWIAWLHSPLSSVISACPNHLSNLSLLPILFFLVLLHLLRPVFHDSGSKTSPSHCFFPVPASV